MPRSTLQDRIKALKSGQEVIFKPKLGRFESTFNENFLLQLYNYVKDLDNRLMPLTRLEFLKLAFDFAEYLKIPHRFNKKKKWQEKTFSITLRKNTQNLF